MDGLHGFHTCRSGRPDNDTCPGGRDVWGDKRRSFQDGEDRPDRPGNHGKRDPVRIPNRAFHHVTHITDALSGVSGVIVELDGKEAAETLVREPLTLTAGPHTFG